MNSVEEANGSRVEMTQHKNIFYLIISETATLEGKVCWV
jgi:hypothetical protein